MSGKPPSDGSAESKRIGLMLQLMREAAGYEGYTSASPIADVTRQTVSDWEDGEGGLKPLMYALRLAREEEKARGYLLNEIDPALEGRVNDRHIAEIVNLLRGLSGHPNRKRILRNIEEQLEITLDAYRERDAASA